MTQFNLMVNSLPRDLTEFIFFLVIGFTAGSMGIIQITLISSQDINFHSLVVMNVKDFFSKKSEIYLE